MQPTNRVRITIRQAFASREGLPLVMTGVIERETPRAIYFHGHAVDNADRAWAGWLPRSCAEVAAVADELAAPQAPSADALADYLADLDYELTLLAAEAAGHRPSQAAPPVAPVAERVVISLTADSIVVKIGADGASTVPRTARAAYELLQSYPRAEAPVEVYKAAAAWKQRLAVAPQPVAAAAR